MRTAGVDEVGVGCLAGPVISAAVSFGNQEPSIIFKDSKKLAIFKEQSFISIYKKFSYIYWNSNSL